MQKLVMFNGPPRSGKDTAGNICRTILGDDMALTKFTTAVKDRAHSNLGLDCPTDYFEELKDTSLPQFKGMTPRQYYIETSRQLRSKDMLAVAKMLVAKLPDIDETFVINTDVGMDYEAQALADYFGPENCLLVRIHRDGKNYDNDCRGHVKAPAGCKVEDIENSTVDKFQEKLMGIISEFSFEATPEFAI